MNKYSFPILLAFIMISIQIVFAQRLPKGAFHTNRERTIDILHYSAELEFEFEKGRCFGTATVTFTPLSEIDTLFLDAIHLVVRGVHDATSNEEFHYRQTPRTLNIALLHRQFPGDTLRVAIRYECTPKAGMYFQKNPQNPSLYFVHTYGEGGLHANWLPVYNDVNDKFSTEMIVTVPSPYVTISNGRLVETKTSGASTTFHWLQELPHSDYLIALYVGEYEKGDLPPAFGSIPLSYWVPKGQLQEGAYAFRHTTAMVEFFSRRLNYRYPWVKYDQIAVPDYSIGAMEHTGVTGHRASVLRDQQAPLDFGPPDFDSYSTDWTAESTISHELAHHWFGDNTTCRNLSSIWLNESFASYMMMLWDEESVGKDQLLFDVRQALDHYLVYVDTEHIIRPLEYHYFDDQDAIYNEEHTYLKGAAILHMLRKILGDEPFFHTLSYYLTKHQFSNVESSDLKTAVEEATGRNVDWFFNQWITGGGHPRFEINYVYLEDRKLIDLTVKQVQPFVEGQGLFTLPVEITIATPDSVWKREVSVREEEEHFVFLSEQKPLMVSFDGEGNLVSEVVFEKEVEELVYQATNDALPGRLLATRQLARSHPTDERTLKLLSTKINQPQFWADAAEAALQLGQVRTPAAGEILAQALRSDDYRIRKAAVLAFGGFGTTFASSLLQDIILVDQHTDVVATAIVVLARCASEAEKGSVLHFLQGQMRRPSWYDEITIACLTAFGDLEDVSAVSIITPYTAEPHNQHVREAALTAWSKIAPPDKALHQLLLETAQSPSYGLQTKAISLLGDLCVSEACGLLRSFLQEDVDPNITSAAKTALEHIERIEGAEK